MRPDGSGTRQLTFRGAHKPFWLPDGKTIFFGSVRSGQARYMSILADGEPGSEKLVGALLAGAQDPVWSPDGSLIAFGTTANESGSRDLWYVRADGGRAVGLTAKFWVREWAWSPDGKTIAFVVGKATGTSLWTAAPGDNKIKLLYKGFCGAPSYSPLLINLADRLEKKIGVRSFGGRRIWWSSDGSRLYFESSRESEPAIWSVGASGRGLGRLTPEGTPAQGLSLDRSSEAMAFQAMLKDSYAPDLHLADADARNVRRLTRSFHSCWSPVWSADGSRLALQSDANHANELFVSISAGKRARAVARLDNPERVEVRWFDHNKRLLVADAGRLLIVDAGGGKDAAKPVPNLDGPAQAPTLHDNRI